MIKPGDKVRFLNAVGGGIVMLWHYFNPNGGIVSDSIGALGEVLFYIGLVFLIWSFFRKKKTVV